MNIVVDTSVWIDFFRAGNDRLLHLLDADVVLAHPMIIGELACGTPRSPRTASLSMLRRLGLSRAVAMEEVLRLVEQEKLYGKGCGLVDMVVLASTLKTPGAVLWSLDKRLTLLAEQFQIAMPSVH
ncbi:type II toxin-antitoxin system VapC family toxin [Roseateles amylovorans]|uniref:PIN domain-containing protein n=1 Tax=Roseateles amylovorans TaxID=2978473 RepID=A0ABY6B4F9_9BURK|nr:PIN domain-containing protein [Roseateles amylovorans]UXH78423.1 PIN domain-containing protein [Roseateles amylovorans]